MIKDAYTLNVKRKHMRSFKLICSAQYSRVGPNNKRVGVLRIHNLDEISLDKQIAMKKL